MLKNITIGSVTIGPKFPPFIIAEMSANHNQSLERALLIVDAAKAAGVHAIKLQTYTPDTMTLDISKKDFLISDQTSLWFGKTLYELYQEAYTPWEWHAPIFNRCKELGLIAFSTPFDSTAVAFLETLDVPFYKIASLEINDHPLIQAVASKGKPVMLSTGGATQKEIDEAIKVARNAGCTDLILLKCTVAYPANSLDSHLKTIPDMIRRFDSLVGLSDHTEGVGVALASIAMGACVIEKHFTISRTDGGVDSAFSLNADEMKSLVTESVRAWQGMGDVFYGPLPSEETNLLFRRSLYFVKDLNKGERIQKEHIRSIRPAHGLHPKEYDHIISRQIKYDVKRGDPVKWDVIT